MARQIKSGPGWRLGWDDTAAEFQGLAAGEHWAVELTAQELADLCRLALQLAESVHGIASELMDEERITCEAESDWIWLEVEGYPHAYSLRFILQTGRRSEGTWSCEAVPSLLQAMAGLTLF
ncbi:MAG: DUF1818 family protein [Cyanobacteria bacterium J06639_16]